MLELFALLLTCSQNIMFLSSLNKIFCFDKTFAAIFEGLVFSLTHSSHV